MQTIVLELCMVVAKMLHEIGLWRFSAAGYQWYALSFFSWFYPAEAKQLSLLWFPYNSYY